MDATKDATKVCITTKFPKRAEKREDQTYLCFEETTPPWDQELFGVKDDAGRIWFCHESNIELTDYALRQFAGRIKEEYTPRDPKVFQRRLHSPLVVQVVLCRAATLDELQQLLGTVKMQRPSMGAAPQ